MQGEESSVENLREIWRARSREDNSRLTRARDDFDGSVAPC